MRTRSTKMVAAARLTWLAAALSLAAPGEVLAQGRYGAPPPPPTYPQWAHQADRGPRWELNGLVGYQISSDIDVVSGSDVGGGTIQVDGAASYGAAVNLKMRPGLEVELFWVWSPTQTRFISNAVGFPSTRPVDVDFHYLQIGGIRSIRRGIAEPFAAASLGAAVVVPDRVTFRDGTTFDPSSNWRLGFTLGAGIKLWLLDRPGDRIKIALRGDARLMAPIYFTTSSFYGGTGGSGFAVSGGIPFTQGNFTGALDIGF